MRGKPENDSKTTVNNTKVSQDRPSTTTTNGFQEFTLSIRAQGKMTIEHVSRPPWLIFREIEGGDSKGEASAFGGGVEQPN